MARFDVHRDRASRVPYLLDVQADHLSTLATRLVVPLMNEAQLGSIIERLHPRFDIAGQRLVLATNLMASIRKSQLGPIVGSLAEERDRVVNAIDFLLQGF